MLSTATLFFEIILSTCLYGLSVNALGSVNEYKKVCVGSDAASPSHDSNPASRYERYRAMYTNCTHVLKSLEIIFLDSNDTYDLSFLKDIREVNGYVYILGNHIEVLPLTSLRVIRGRTLYRNIVPSTKEYSYFSLYIAFNSKANSTNIGLKEVQLTSLYEISAGNVIFIDNFLLCYVNTIVWEDIFIGRSAKVWFENEPSPFHVPCETSCHDNCSTFNDTEPAHCWGPEPDQCQQRHPKLCHKECDGRCYGPGESDCCDSQCIGGCTGRSNSDCWACKTFNDDGACVEYCPPVIKYNSVTFTNEDNVDGKFAYGLTCIKNCSSVNMIADGGGCVTSCRHGYRPENGRCVPCSGVCEKTCEGVIKWVDSENIKTFADCTVIDGNIDIKEVSFTGDQRNNISELLVEELEVFQSVRQINGYLRVEGSNPALKNLSFFKSLSVVMGQKLFSNKVALSIVHTQLEYLGLTSLRQVITGSVAIRNNARLCYPSLQVWKSLVPDKRLMHERNANATECPRCSEQCDDRHGCWGPNVEHCRRCKNYRYQEYCIPECNVSHLATLLPSNIYDNVTVYVVDSNATSADKLCQQCHEECSKTCFGQGADQCKSCRHYKDGPYCVRQCPKAKYPLQNGTCQPCHANCHEHFGCSGPSSKLGIGGCNLCAKNVFDWYNQSKISSNDSSLLWQPGQCMSSTSECPEGFYSYHSPRPISFQTANGTISRNLDMCRKCHPECVTCSDSTAHCSKCRHFRQEQYVKDNHFQEESQLCVDKCSHKHYLESNTSDLCLPCHKECDSCDGPTEYECLVCTNYRVDFIDSTPQRTFCSATCPTDKPVVCSAILTGESREREITESEQINNYAIIGAVVPTVLCLFIVVAGAIKYSRSNKEIKKKKLEAKLSGYDDIALQLTDKRPDMALLRVINDSELNLLQIIGSGAFGTVYKGVWSPASEKTKLKIPVAVKILQTCENSGDLLDEARVMASVHHPCCIRIIAVSMTAQVKLVTQFMPQGCLLDYVRKNKQNIGSLTLLNWAAQTASGMKHLEDLGIVHRDLAARNILLQSPNQVKITDFGLAKLLKNDDYILSTGGKVPIKWLALESIQFRLFTHKTDVWSYGVTLWEIFTFGERPFETVPALQMAEVLEKGERLMQPGICTIDVYMLMIKCWMVDADCRPSFSELHSEFSKMSKDPGRYLVIQGDKLMRLPSHTPESEQLLYDTSLNLDDIVTDVVNVSAEEYLRPQDIDQATWQESQIDDTYENVNNNTESQLSPRTKLFLIDSCNKPIFERKMSQRYGADPCREDVESERIKLAQRRRIYDETNYIEPASSVHRKTYLELIEDTVAPLGYMDMTSPPIAVMHQPFIADNPEYFSDVIKQQHFCDNPEYFSDVMEPEQNFYYNHANQV